MCFDVFVYGIVVYSPLLDSPFTRIIVLYGGGIHGNCRFWQENKRIKTENRS